ncbi:MAG TPA: extracellular solute-binding protein [Firmicutes bacterium]|nr:extracellular solute-binding protein [Bacillota bacterium]
MKKLRGFRVGAGLLAASMFLSLIGCSGNSSTAGSEMTPRVYRLDDAAVSEKWVSYRPEDVALEVDLSEPDAPVSGEGVERQAGGVLMSVDAACEITLNVPGPGEYWVLAEYEPVSINMFENPVTVSLGGTEVTCSLPFLWEDDVSEVRTDRYGNEVVPDQQYLDAPSLCYLEDYEHFTRTPIRFSLEAGENTLVMTAQNQDILLRSIRLIRPSEDLAYAEYRAQYADAAEFEGILRIEGEDYRAKSDSYIRGRNVQNTSLTPNDPYVKMINATDDKSNKTMGQKVLYEVEVPQDGVYYLSFKYSQPLKSGGAAYRTIEVDGEVPFAEARDMAFVHTGIDIYGNATLGGEEPLGIYLTAGLHTIALKVTAGPMDALYQELLAVVNEINDAGIQMKRIKGSNSDDTAAVDSNRTWDILQYMPDILTDLQDWQDRLSAVYQTLEEATGEAPAFASDLSLAVQNLERLASEPREIPNRMALLSDDSSSAAQLVALSLTKIYDQNLSIDCFYLHGADTRLPSASANFLDGLVTGIQQFFYSFSPVMNEAVDVKNSDGALTVWINKPSQYVEALRELTAQSFTEQTGIDVVYSIMPDEKKITLANSTGSNPDIALGLSYYRPAEFAMRGMAKNLLEYDDFLDWYGAEYNLQALAPMAYEDGIYGASETQDFYVLFYRTDILESLGLEVPDTWDDVKEMMPALHRNAMNFNLPLANNVGYKSFEATGAFIFQNGGDYYSADGFTSNFRDPNTLKGLREMTDLYRVYGLIQNVPNFFNAFRSGSVPIGVSNFSTYLQLQMSAPELSGRWDIALVPGTVQEDGTVARYYSAAASSAMIFSNTRMPEESYEFLKWWLSSETQIEYATSLQMKYGPDYVWNTANHVAFAQMSYPRKHKEVILEQWSWQKEALRHPASYILEREVSNAWIDIVTEGESFQPRIDEATLAADREMMRKLTEFGYYDEDGSKVKEYNVHLIDDLIAQQEGKEAVSSE